LGDGGDYIYLDEWLSGEPLDEARTRFAEGVAAFESCVEAGAFDEVDTAHPEIDEVRRFSASFETEDDATEPRPEDNDEYVDITYARNGGVIILMTLYLARRDAYSEEQIERTVDTAVDKLAAIGRVEVTGSRNHVVDTAQGDATIAPAVTPSHPAE
jgi:hypothetical protein